jgi:hypothetical protein
MKTINGWPKSWTDEGIGLTRQVANLGNKKFSTAEVIQHKIEEPNISFSPGIEIEHAIQVRKNGVFDQLVLIGTIQEGDEFKIHSLRSPGKSTTRSKIMELFGVELDNSSTVFATTAFATEAKGYLTKDGLLVSQTSNTFAFDVINSLVVSAISAERIILENANKAVFEKDFLTLNSRKHLARLNNWISIPSSDSTRLLEDIESLRTSLKLTERSEQIAKVLAQQARSADFAIAAFVGTLGFVSAFLSNFTGTTQQIFLTWYQTFLIATVMAGIGAMIAFSFARRT